MSVEAPSVEALPGRLSGHTVPASRRPELVVLGLTARRAIRSAVVWGGVAGLYLASSALGYAGTYTSPEARAQLRRTFGSNPGVNAIIGPAHAIDTVAGFTAWRSLGVLSIVGAVWGLLLATRLLRGEEESFRWEMLLAGATTRRAATAQALLGLGAGLVVLWAVPATVAALVGRSADVGFSVSAALFDALASVCAAAVFLGVGALTSQLAATRRLAAGYAAATLGVCYALRMVADSGTSLGWLRWISPLGWPEQARPLTGSRPLALLPVVGLVAVLVVVTVRLSGARDLGDSSLPDRSTAAARTALLAGPIGLSTRLLRPSVLGWLVGVGAISTLMGLVSKSAGQAIAEAPGFAATLAKLGVSGSGATVYLGVGFLVVALLTAMVAAAQLGAARDEEASGRLEQLLVRPVSRQRWLFGRLTLAVVALGLVGLVAALGAWAGAASQHADVGFGRLLEAGVNVLPPAAVVLGAGVLALGLRPRSVAAVTYGLVAWSFLVEILGGVVQADHWLLDTSLFHHMAAAPATAPDWGTGLVLTALAVLSAAVGTAAFVRRDLAGE
ncbi:MAG TPA: polyketide antibiotic transporter [Frankiaceae bacterium]|nr:polyketide antibiotic transporter [Frankiaceae bacterium]